MKKKTFLIGFACLLLLVTGVRASFWIYSNIVHVSYSYDLTLTETHTMSSVELSATLFYNEMPQVDVPISFLLSNNPSGPFNVVGSANTNMNGEAIYTYLLSNATADLYFRAGYQSP